MDIHLDYGKTGLTVTLPDDAGFSVEWQPELLGGVNVVLSLIHISEPTRPY